MGGWMRGPAGWAVRQHQTGLQSTRSGLTTPETDSRPFLGRNLKGTLTIRARGAGKCMARLDRERTKVFGDRSFAWISALQSHFWSPRTFDN